MYAQVQNGRYPNTEYYGNFGTLNLLPKAQRDMFEQGKYGVSGGLCFYCPYWPKVWRLDSKTAWKTERTDTDPPTPTYPIGYTLWSANPTMVRIVDDYIETDKERVALGAQPLWEHITRIAPMIRDTDKGASIRPLLFDEVMWYRPNGPYGGDKYSHSVHVERKGVPAGGNAVYGDGHAAWRRYTEKSLMNRGPNTDRSIMFPVFDKPDYKRFY
jgi:hypothetical protein